MTENQYEDVLLALGAKDITTNRQRSNGTTAFKLPTGQVVAEYKSGYIRRNLYQEDLPYGKCYQLNPTYDTQYKVFTLGQEFSYKNKARMRILNRDERLRRLVLYTTKKLNDGNN